MLSKHRALEGLVCSLFFTFQNDIRTSGLLNFSHFAKWHKIAFSPAIKKNILINDKSCPLLDYSPNQPSCYLEPSKCHARVIDTNLKENQRRVNQNVSNKYNVN